MRACVIAEEMKKFETNSIQNIGILSLVLMERAALCVAKEVKKHSCKEDKIYVICGIGNNGADGIAVARILHIEGYVTKIIPLGDRTKATEEYVTQEKIANKIGIEFLTLENMAIDNRDIIVDGIFGIGLKRNIEGEYKKAVEIINKTKCKAVISIDIPSGISADNGEVLGCAVKANKTVTFGLEKQGLYLGEGREYTGRVVLKDIGFQKDFLDSVLKVNILEKSDLKYIPMRKENSNKGTYGKLLVIAGSAGMSGAAYLCGLAAYKAGAGLVKFLTEEENREVLQTSLPEAIVETYTEETIKEKIEKEVKWATTVIIGPGIGQTQQVKTLVEETLENFNVPIIIDSDGLNTISRFSELTKLYKENVIITPHLKEMSRLINQDVEDIKKEKIKYAEDYRKKHGVTCVLKDSITIIAGEETYMNINGNSSLAKGGTGDVLTGIIGGLICIGMDTTQAAAYGAYLHGRAGVKASKNLGKHSVLASEVIAHLEMR